MVENLVDDGSRPKSTIIEAFGDVKPTVNVMFKVKVPFEDHTRGGGGAFFFFFSF